MQDMVEKMTAALPTLNFEKYWSGFQGNAFAIYDEYEVYLFNHPDCSENPYISFPKDDRFVSCTSIVYEDIPTAIVDVRYFDNFEDIYSLVIHESFHAYQQTLGESRFPDEAVGPSFPADPHFIRLRIQEREALHTAVFEGAADRQQELINRFITLRDERIRLFPSVVDYENRVESIEGPAFYVEYQSLRDIGDPETALVRYAAMLLDAEDSHLHIRKSCYSSGHFLCLLLDRISSDWHDAFMHSELQLYEFFKTRFPDYLPSPVGTNDNEKVVARIIQTINDQKNAAFQSFNNQTGIRLMLIGPMQVAGFDPMNIVIQEDQALHSHFLKVRRGSAEYFIKGPMLTEFEGDFRKMNRLEVFVENPPVKTTDAFEIEGIGSFSGSFEYEEDNSLKIILD